MDYLTAFNISASGMTAERTRLDVIAMNLANVHTTHGKNGMPYSPLKVITTEKQGVFSDFMNGSTGSDQNMGVEIQSIQPMNVPPKMVYDPQNPDANTKGYVAYPNINSMSEMVNMIETLRSYEANVRAMNAAKSMAEKALEIGSQK